MNSIFFHLLRVITSNQSSASCVAVTSGFLNLIASPPRLVARINDTCTTDYSIIVLSESVSKCANSREWRSGKEVDSCREDVISWTSFTELKHACVCLLASYSNRKIRCSKIHYRNNSVKCLLERCHFIKWHRVWSSILKITFPHLFINISLLFDVR